MQRPCRWTLVCALFRGRSKTHRDRETQQEKSVVDAVHEEEMPERVVHQSVEVRPPVLRQTMPDRNFGPMLFGGIVSSFVLYVVCRIVFKDRSEMIEKIEFDLNCVMDQLKTLKELRKEPNLLESDIIRIRSYLLSLIIKQKKQDPERVINGALTLLGEKQLSRKEKRVLLGIHKQESVKPAAAPPESLPDLSGLRMLDDVKLLDDLPLSLAYDPNASLFWWHKLPYICILRMKKTGAVFMTDLSKKHGDAFALLGFEDPEEAFHAGKMPVHQQRWGVLSEMKQLGMKPERPLEDEKHFDLTWLQPQEFNALMESAGCYGAVIPAGTLRSMVDGRPIPSSKILSAISEICLSERIGATKARASEKRELNGDRIDQMSNGTAAEHGNVVLSMGPAIQNGRLPAAHAGSAVSATPDARSSQLGATGDSSSEHKADSAPGHAEVSAQESTSHDVDQDVEPSDHGRDKAKSDHATYSDSPGVERNESIPQSNGTSQKASSGPWWLDLDYLVVPKIKIGGEAGSVEINISIDPESADFRLVLFEDEREAKYFLGVLGKLHGPETLVAVQKQTPSEFLSHNHKLDASKLVVLCTGALLLDRDTDREGLRNSVRLAHVATEIKKGVPYAPSPGEDDSFDQRAMRVAETVVSKFKDRMETNAQTQRKEGDADYLDPVEGLMHDLESGGLDMLFGPETRDRSSEGDAQTKPFPGFDASGDGRDDGLYADFVAQMTKNIDKTQDDIRNQTAAPSASSPKSNDTELDASLDDLILEKADEERREAEEDEGFDVIYPGTTSSGGHHKRGPEWFSDLGVIYMPEFLSVKGDSSYLAMSDGRLEKQLVIGFQDRREANVCKEMMKTWPEEDNMAAGVEAISPQMLLTFCQEYAAVPVVIRRNLLPLSLDMSREAFLNQVSLIAETQISDYPVFNG